MTRTARWTTVVLTPIAIVSLLLAAFPSFATDLGLDVWNVSELERQIEECSRNSERYSRETKYADLRGSLKRDATTQLIRGERDFASTVDYFENLNNEDEKSMQFTRRFFPAKNDRCSCAKQVLCYVKNSPEIASPEVIAHLTAECDEFIGDSEAK